MTRRRVFRQLSKKLQSEEHDKRFCHVKPSLSLSLSLSLSFLPLPTRTRTLTHANAHSHSQKLDASAHHSSPIVPGQTF